MASASNIEEIHAWALATKSAVRNLESAAWFTVERTGNDAIVRIGNDIGTGGASAEMLLATLEGVPSIELQIDSRGGDGDTALVLKRGLQGRVQVCSVNNLCASAAVIIAATAKKTRVEGAAKFMLHSPKSFVFQNANGLREAANRLGDTSAAMKAILKHRTGQPDAIIDTWFDSGKDFYFTAQEAVDAGLADEIFTAPPLSPLDPANFDNATDEAEIFRLLNTFPAIRVKDRAKFIRNISAAIVHKTREV
ncbi:MAG TPA: ATP-dependent Clp protease proteolytic subunit [Verrucomicrobiae bacterium]|nr:ATP-dependent Clp protease proteolytic subunit [Verrucomicrobiae bacterium]